MDKVTFVLPTLAASGMSKADQNDLLLNQATAIIVSAWLNHANAVVSSLAALGLPGTGTHTKFEWLITRAELAAFIDSVQGALKSI